MTATFHCAALAVLVTALSGCAMVGPSSISNGRSTYNEVINRTEDEQILSMIVRQRYDETFGMLVVSNVTASLRTSAKVGANAGVGPESSYAGNLVPLSAEATYEENPTISYVPLRGEQFVERMLAPISAEQALLLSRMSTDDTEVLRFLVRRVNGLVNPVYSSRHAGNDFDRFLDLYTRLREAGNLDIIKSRDGQFELMLHDYTGDQAKEVGELLRMLGVKPRPERAPPTTLPIRFFVGSPRADSIDIETPSALEIIEAAASGVDVPGDDLVKRLARPAATTARSDLITIHSSRDRPRDASVAVMYRGWWFFVDGRDNRSKQGFMILRTLIGMRLDATGPGQGTPVLTVPVSR